MPARTALRPFTVVAALAALAIIAFLTLNPGWIVGPLRGAFVGELWQFAGGMGADLDLERTLNTIMFVPLGAAIAALVPWRWGLVGAVAGLVVSASVEIAQGFIPGRVSDPTDVVWNAAGAAAGAAIVFVVRAAAAGVRAVATASTAPRRASR